MTALTGRVALITGASRGIGRAIAQRLAAHGVAVVLSASARSAEGLEESCRRIRAVGGKAKAVIADLADSDECAALGDRAGKVFGPIDILVNNAAAIPAFAPPSRIDRAAREATFAVNFHAAVDLTQALLPGMREQGWGRVLNISSETARQPPIPYPGSPALVHKLALYGAAKAALERYTQALAAELHGSGVHVNAILPSKIAHTEGADEVVRALGDSRPEWVEPVEMMAEAAYCAIAGPVAGVVSTSRDLLQMLQQPLHALDGTTPLGDALMQGAGSTDSAHTRGAADQQETA
ncbi:SDR family NAD(P)-dependent oxidoreductase [Algiphilus aromaticivorans]|uniref:SDR family NAD(P)-dependent oxidoreductase n=1 Tax=Algiphilus aromaticivorans TaxID=382454 RepID=UPI000A02099C|nr:SDR family NAD(P)-dependent oxidoreductase [Algiphilus aromaticivorans]